MGLPLTQLKRDAKSGLYEGRMILRNGTADVPEGCRDWRKIVDANTVSIYFLNKDNKKSQLSVPCSGLIEYTGDSLITYLPGLRELNSEEQAFLEKWENKKLMTDYARRAEIDLLTDGSSTYWQKKYFFTDNGFEYLLGYEEKQGKKYDFSTGKVRDNTIKGAKCMEYEIRKIA